MSSPLSISDLGLECGKSIKKMKRNVSFVCIAIIIVMYTVEARYLNRLKGPTKKFEMSDALKFEIRKFYKMFEIRRE